MRLGSATAVRVVLVGLIALAASVPLAMSAERFSASAGPASADTRIAPVQMRVPVRNELRSLSVSGVDEAPVSRILLPVGFDRAPSRSPLSSAEVGVFVPNLPAQTVSAPPNPRRWAVALAAEAGLVLVVVAEVIKRRGLSR